MWKLIVADDEPKIRRGIESMLDWKDLNVEIVGEAEDGEIALEEVKQKKPEIILLDINMPFLNGLNLLEKLNEINNKSIVIIISGYDDFHYAQKALQFNVFDYILKPVSKKDMEQIIRKAVNKLDAVEKENNYLKWVDKQLNKNIDVIKKNFFSEWLNNKLTDDEVLKEMKFFNIDFGNNIRLVVLKLFDKLNIEVVDKKWNFELLRYAIINLLNDEFKGANVEFIFDEDRKNIIVVGNMVDVVEWINIGKKLESEIFKYLKCHVIIEQANVTGGILQIKEFYLKMINIVEEKKKYSTMVLLAIKYIEESYYLNDLNINNISEKLEVSSSYLSKLLKKETGLSFIDYLTNIRIKKAMYILEDPTVKIYDVAELVGYSNQHYFCRAFKKVVGISPTEYKRGK